MLICVCIEECMFIVLSIGRVTLVRAPPWKGDPTPWKGDVRHRYDYKDDDDSELEIGPIFLSSMNLKCCSDRTGSQT